MQKGEYNQSLFIFRRDLRLDDNNGLIQALKKSNTIIPCFVFDPAQIESKKNSYKSENCLQFMIESLQDLDQQLSRYHSRLFYFLDNPTKIVEKLCKAKTIDAVFVNEDYTPFSQKRDAVIEAVCNKYQVVFHSFADTMLHTPGSFLSSSKKPYLVYTAYYKRALQEPIARPSKNSKTNYLSKTKKFPDEISLKEIEKFYHHNKNILVHGGRTPALKILKDLKKFNTYNKERNTLTFSTTHLSAYHKFGCVSIREVFHAFVKDLAPTNELFKQLFWRDFFYQLSYHFPHVYGSAFKKELNTISWKNNHHFFERWCAGKTGFPVVDACMRELNTTGYMHNRGRLIVASFLVKDLLCNWQDGERYFAHKLVDYDPAQNNGNWQWVASTGADRTPYFRIFNPWLQSKKFDPQAEYIKKWVPELGLIPAQHIHTWNKNYKKYENIKYPAPIIDHIQESRKALILYKEALKVF
jgi:deoxyribodipyrimidine photo-lyase